MKGRSFGQERVRYRSTRGRASQRASSLPQPSRSSIPPSRKPNAHILIVFNLPKSAPNLICHGALARIWYTKLHANRFWCARRTSDSHALRNVGQGKSCRSHNSNMLLLWCDRQIDGDEYFHVFTANGLSQALRGADPGTDRRRKPAPPAPCCSAVHSTS
jgi:hypothetical protein